MLHKFRYIDVVAVTMAALFAGIPTLIWLIS